MKVLIVDDHALIREALHAVLKQLKREAVIFEASNSRQAMHIVEEHPDISLILLDINLPDRDGFSVLRELRDRYATIAIIILSSSDDQDTVKRAFKLGALGFIPKTTEREVMLNAIKLVFSGGIYIPSEILEETTSPRLTNKLATRDSLKGLGLTDRQIEVLALLMKGKSNKVIAKTLNMAVPTVKNHITVVLKALSVTSRTEAVIKVGKMGTLGRIRNSTNSSGPCGPTTSCWMTRRLSFFPQTPTLCRCCTSTSNWARSDHRLRRPENFQPAPIFCRTKNARRRSDDACIRSGPGWRHAARSRPRRRRSDAPSRSAVASPTIAPRLASPSLLDPRHPWPFFGSPSSLGLLCRRGRRARGGAPVRCRRGRGRPRHALPLPLAR